MRSTVDESPVSEEHKALVDQLCLRARAASLVLAQASTELKNTWLRNLAHALRAGQSGLVEANALDLVEARQLSSALKERLTLTPARIEAMAKGLEQLAGLPDPVGRVREERALASGIQVQKVGVPLGVVLFIYESRPNVTVDAAGLCVKSGNAIILRGGKEAHASNRARTVAANPHWPRPVAIIRDITVQITATIRPQRPGIRPLGIGRLGSLIASTCRSNQSLTA